ncbi:MAG TPA: hypothetical protein VEK15_31420 [Vicinamibacteria bacterium]|nr:hypothetical protein [Vicinamibacteria bacterium]
MMSRILLVVLVALLEATVGSAGPRRPETVSPGSNRTVLEIAERCPTFSWGVIEGAIDFDLVVYEIQTGDDPGAAEPKAVLRQSVPGNVHSWTPSLQESLARGKHYAWYIRATDEWEPGEWSEARFFRVEAVPSVEEVVTALDILTRFLESRGESQPLEQLEKLVDPTRIREPMGERSEPPSGPTDPHQPAPAFASGASAIHAELPDTEGVTYGLVGVSHSASGAGLAGENTAGGPDLVLGGATTSLRMTESGIDVPSAAGHTFNLQNSGAGAMTLQVDGNTAYHTGNDGPGSGLDADLLDGSDSSAFALASHNHSGTYAPASHSHSGADITSGTVGQSFVDGAIARDNEILPTVLANDGAGSTLDADLLDGVHASSFASANHSHSGPLTQVRRFQGWVGPQIPISEIAYSFRGPTVDVTVATGQQIIGAAVAPLATTSGGVASGRAGLCYQLGSGEILNFVGFDATVVEVGTIRAPIAVSSGTPTDLVSGSYKVGFCFKNESTVVINRNDWVNGWVAVVNP